MHRVPNRRTACPALRNAGNARWPCGTPETRGGPAERRKRAVALRKERNLSVEEIGAILAQEGTPVSASAVNRMLREAGLPKL